MLFDRIFGYPILEAQLKDRAAEVQRLITENKELRDRLFIKFQLPVSGQSFDPVSGESIAGWASKRQRLKTFIDAQQPLTTTLTNDEMQFLREKSQ